MKIVLIKKFLSSANGYQELIKFLIIMIRLK
jgi:hypothetical protein